MDQKVGIETQQQAASSNNTQWQQGPSPAEKEKGDETGRRLHGLSPTEKEKRDEIDTVARVVNGSHASDNNERRRWLEAGSVGCP